MAKSILRGLFAVTKRGFSHISDDPDALHKAIHPVCGLLGYLPGRAGAYWRQVADYMNKNALAQLLLTTAQNQGGRRCRPALCTIPSMESAK